MSALRQRGILLLPVMLMLAVVGALALAMTRDGSMSVSAVEREYEIARVRYLAEAAVTLAKWQNEQAGCGMVVRHAAAVSLPGGTVRIDNVSKADHGVAVEVSATLSPGADAALTPATLAVKRTLRLHDLGSKMEVTIGADGGSDTHVQEGAVPLFLAEYLEMTDGKSHGLIKFSLGSIPAGVIVTRSELRLKQFYVKASQSSASLAVHRVSADWDQVTATWTFPWAAGGAYAAPVLASAAIGIDPASYSLRIDALVESWANQALANYGLLLKPDGLTELRVHSFDQGSDGPQLFVRYYPSCPK